MTSIGRIFGTFNKGKSRGCSDPTRNARSQHWPAPTSTRSEIQTTLPSRVIYKTMGVAAGAVLGLVAIATAIIIATPNPPLSGKVLAVAVAMFGVVGLAAAVVALVLRRLRLPNDNDAWVFW